ncbi:AAA domain (plasmid) [Candidatus Rhabdochlamydia oedothoracis]|uniref:AAA domain n=1 Tax=Candidatus Rhabdochlamydia oedothoracis TaxID=2720720 RepID=A0ABX8V3M8_9BACT|nr:MULTISPECIES: AAA family ATPase [Rhabdochlamydia]KAG6559267.1 Regulatory protein RepA [Candidatus Rhabdochlamydia sp. W815]QYF49471.1 AAA domain [Candidatus Rhabdochlamydia oedothoracis]
MTRQSYLILLPHGRNLRPLQDKFYEIGGFYNGIGYVFPFQKEQTLKQIIKHLPDIKIRKIDLEDDHTFDSIRQAHNASYFRDKLFTLDHKILSIIHTYQLDELSEISVESLQLPPEQKTQFLELIQEKEKLKRALEWAEGMEKTLSSQKLISFQMKFISEQSVNFLLKEAPKMPRLINYMEGSYVKAFIRKGIVGMLVGSGGVGKTHALAQLAISITTGIPWLGKYPVEKTGYVFMGMGENSEEDIHRLLRKTVKKLFREQTSFFDKNPLLEASTRLAVASFNGLDSSFIYKGKPTQAYELLLQELKEKEPKEGWSCIILDPISRFLGADAETDNASATRFIALLERLTLELEGHPTVLFGHHMSKNAQAARNTDQGAARGSSAITDGVRWQANLEKIRKTLNSEEEEYELDQIILRYVKSNFTAILPSLRLKKDEDGILFAQDPNQSIFKKR